MTKDERIHVGAVCAGVLGAEFRIAGHDALLPRVGSKARFDTSMLEHSESLKAWHKIHSIVKDIRTQRAPKLSVWANDLSVWGKTWSVLPNPALRWGVLDVLRGIAGKTPSRELYAELAAKLPSSDVELVAHHLVLERWAFGGKPVAIKDGRFVTPGYNKAAAEGVPSTGKFGAVRPQLPSLIDRIERFPTNMTIYGSQLDVHDIKPSWLRDNVRLTFIDGPYPGTTGFGHDVVWERLLDFAIELSDEEVIFCSGQPEPRLAEAGWFSVEPVRKGKKTTIGTTKHTELMYFSPKMLRS